MPGIVTVSLWYTVTIFIGYRHYFQSLQLPIIDKWNINISKR